MLGLAVQGPLLPPPPMDPNLLITELMPLVGVVVVLLVGALIVRVLLRSPFGEAVAERIRARTQQRFGGTGDVERDRVAQLEQHVMTLQSQLAEVAERVDFAERLLAERRERKLSAGQ